MKNTTSFFSTPVIADFSAKKYAFLQFAEAEEIKKVQTELFLNHLKFTVNNSPFYKKLYKEKSIALEQIKELSDIECLPLTKKIDLSSTEDFLCVDNTEIVDVCLTSSTS